MSARTTQLLSRGYSGGVLSAPHRSEPVTSCAAHLILRVVRNTPGLQSNVILQSSRFSSVRYILALTATHTILDRREETAYIFGYFLISTKRAF